MADKNDHATLNRRSLLKSAGAFGAASLGLPLGTNPVGAVQTGDASQWTRTDANKITLTDETTAPVINDDSAVISDDYWIWDTWPLRHRDGSIVKINGWQIVFSLTASKDLVPGARHNEAMIRYFYSRNGHDWQEGGEAFENPLGHHQWAGSAMYDENEDQIYHFYTATSPEPEFRQRLALGKGATLETNSQSVELTGEQEHVIMAEADGDLYQTLEQSREQGIVYAFRDPWYFQHPETGEDLIVFEGNTPTGGDSPDDPESYNGNVGVMQATNEELTEWELLPPNLEAIEVNQQLERPHYVFNNGRWYLFVLSHEFTFAPGLSGPDALYGFVSDSLYGDYEPLNESGLVIANPEAAPFQAYSWLAMPQGDNILVESFENFRGLDDTSQGEISLDEVGSLPAEEQKELFGGTLAPSLKVQLEGTETRIVSELNDGHFLPSGGSDGGGNGSNR
ncbi:levansucrase/invertase [Halalkalicoccus paucihalophilus]|uniref:Levansucrase/invertase n=1 Tax=Halalkalicoccus paucihalophilus TaxID=1008153 RepID=A0A151A9R2_9EURY|nr:glycoside hydrolase family 68 protein [Halalkalicoccus paucihalophilus]KYH24232.1 levansucrase/invertase [Halalkalicoccus paucihalophilus]